MGKIIRIFTFYKVSALERKNWPTQNNGYNGQTTQLIALFI